MTRRLLTLNGIAVLGVVVNHSVAWGFVAMFWWTHRYRAVTVPNFDQLGSFSYYSLRSFEQLIAFSISAFLFVSGFFIAFQVKKGMNGIGRDFLANRLKSLIIPYLIWSVIMFAADFVQGQVFTPLTYIRKLLIGEAAPAFYFVPLISQLYLLSPLLTKLLEKRWKLLLIVTAAIQILVQILKYDALLGGIEGLSIFPRILIAGWFFASSWFWFVMGMVAGYHLDKFKDFTKRTRWVFLVFAGVMLIAGIFEWEAILSAGGGAWQAPKETLVDNLFAFSVLMAFFGFSNIELPLNNWLGKVGSQSYGIYLSHSIVLIIVAKLVYHLLPAILEYQIILQPLLVIAGLGVPMLLMRLVKASPVKAVYGYLFG